MAVTTQVNGDIAPFFDSALLQHILNYPLISDSLTTVKSNAIAQRSIAIGDSAYKTFAVPVIPYLSKPYQYVSPYVERADSFGDKALDRLDEALPIVKKPTAELYNDTKEIIFFPLNKALEGRAHVLEVYSTETKKHEQEGIVGQGKAAVATGLVLSTETLAALSTFISSKKAEATQVVKEKINQ